MNMILIYLLIFIISIDGIITTNISKNSLSNRFLIISSCQIESIPIPSDRHYYFYFASQSSSSLSSSSSSSSFPLLYLSYCEHQQTTSYSSSGFSILYSSARLPLTDIEEKKHSSSFHHNTLDQSSSATSPIITLMSSSNENHTLVDDDANLISTITTVFPNLSFSSTSLPTTPQKGNQTFNMMLLVGCVIVGILIMIITYIIVKCCHRDEGTYKIDESKHFPTKSLINNSTKNGCTGKISSSNYSRQKLLTTNDQKMNDSKEWYV